MTGRRRKAKKSKKSGRYVMFGFNRNDIDEAGYLGRPVHEESGITFPIVQDVKDALVFPRSNENHVKGFGTPEQWLDFWNSDEDNVFKFHLVKVTI